MLMLMLAIFYLLHMQIEWLCLFVASSEYYQIINFVYLGGGQKRSYTHPIFLILKPFHPFEVFQIVIYCYAIYKK